MLGDIGRDDAGIAVACNDFAVMNQKGGEGTQVAIDRPFHHLNGFAHDIAVFGGGFGVVR
ncbi:MAG: hypothetical protein J6386_07910 [Candidatus Synoicihabitans palmerolidicus]|nr:hypothetical protein [Candidatus Synoicihabitans palmerolidicus]